MIPIGCDVARLCRKPDILYFNVENDGWLYEKNDEIGRDGLNRREYDDESRDGGDARPRVNFERLKFESRVNGFDDDTIKYQSRRCKEHREMVSMVVGVKRRRIGGSSIFIVR